MNRPRTVLLCHHDSPIHEEGIARWLASWTDLRGIVVIEEPRGILRKRLRREAARVGWLRVLDVIAFRLFYRFTAAAADQAWNAARLSQLREQYPPVPATTPVLRVATPNSAAAQQFIAAAQPELILALCKNMLAERIFTLATTGTFVLHPGICPEYRNAHGCFWALAEDDVNTVGVTLLRIDRGVDTGPVFGYFRTAFDEVADSHIRIQHAIVLDNLPAIAQRLQEVVSGEAAPIPVAGRASRAWGQPWLTAYLRWKRHARRRRDARQRD